MVYVWTFRLDRHDSSGQPLPTVTVAMTGTELNGLLNNGDLVEVKVPRKWQFGEVLATRAIRNLTGNMTVEAHGWTAAARVGYRVWRLVAWLILLGVIALIAYVALHTAHKAIAP
jgi:hypothetical protein